MIEELRLSQLCCHRTQFSEGVVGANVEGGGREGGRRETGTLSSRWVGWGVAEGPRRRRTRALVRVLRSPSEEEGGREEEGVGEEEDNEAKGAEEGGAEEEKGREDARL